MEGLMIFVSRKGKEPTMTILLERFSLKFLILLVGLGAVVGLAQAQEIAGSTRIHGLVSDSLTGEGLPFASILIQSADDSLFTFGTITQGDGKFEAQIPFSGTCRITASYMGYSPKILEFVAIQKPRTIRLELMRKSFSLSEFEVKTDKNASENTLEKTTVNFSKNIAQTGGTAVEALQTIASVDFDVDGNLNYRGSDKVMILVNGEKSELVKSLSQIPADQIEKIELIKNPSARYDAEGMSGIINIVLKSPKSSSSKTSLQVQLGYPETWGINGGYSGKVGQVETMIHAGVFRQTKFQTKEHFRDNYGNPLSYNFYQYDRQDLLFLNAFLQLKLGYVVQKRHRIGLSGMAAWHTESPGRQITYKTLDKLGEVVSHSRKDLEIDMNNLSVDGSLSYQYLFTNPRHSLKALGHYSNFQQDQEMVGFLYVMDELEMQSSQNTLSTQTNRLSDVSVDYAFDISDSLELEVGYNGSWKNLQNVFDSESFTPSQNLWSNDSLIDSEFRFMQQVQSLYVNLGGRWSSLQFQAGLRMEYSDSELNGNASDSYADLFPSANISYRFSELLEFYGAYTRRINRPTIKMLNPYTDEYADITNLHEGNPDLLPEYVNSVEVGNRWSFKKWNGSISLYHRNIDQAITRVKSATNDSALVVTFLNLNSALLWGGELSINLNPFKFWSINTSANLFKTHMLGEYGLNMIDRQKWAWTANISNQFKLPWQISLQVSGFYRSKLPSAMGLYLPRYQVDFALGKKLWNEKGMLIFKISDVFNSYRYGLDLEALDDNGYAYSQTNRRKNESQYFILSFTFNIDGKAVRKEAKKEQFYLDSYDKY